MKQYELIRTAHRVYGKSIREIAKEFGHSRKTVRKALRGVVPRYCREQTPRKPVMESFLPIIDEWLRSDLAAPKKQRHTARRIYHRLVEEYQFAGAESTVRHHVRLRKRELGLKKLESMIPMIAEAGKEAEVDWGEASVIISGKTRKVYLFCMRPRFSGKRFVRAYPHEKQEMFFEGHIEAFHYFGGVFETLIYDNLRTAVKKILRGHSRVQQDQFVHFRTYYTFSARFCNPSKGHEKGGVEGLVGYSRRNFLVPIPQFDTFEELNEYLIRQCRASEQTYLQREGIEQSIEQLSQQEQPLLLNLPQKPFTNVQVLSAKVNAYQTVCVDRNHYSVPAKYTGLDLRVSLGCWKIELFDAQHPVAQHQRLFGRGLWSLNPLDYLETLSRKPGAFDQARPILIWEKQWPMSYRKMLIHLREKRGFAQGTREFVEILKLHRVYRVDKVQTAMQLAMDAGSYGVESVKLLLDEGWYQQLSFQSLEADRIPGVTNLSVEKPDLSQFNQLMN